MKRGLAINQGKMIRFVLQGVAFGAAATVLVLIFTVRGDTIAHLRDLSPGYLPVLFAMVVTAWACNGARVWLMCRALGHPLRYRQAIAVSLSTEFGIAATPAGVGGTVIRITLLRQAGVPFTMAGSLIATDAAIDVVFFSLLAPFAIYALLRGGMFQLLFKDTSDLHAMAGLGAIVAAVVVAIFLLRTERFHRALAVVLNATRWGRRKRLAVRHRHLRMSTRRTIRRVITSLTFLWKHRKSALFLNFTFASVQWSCRYMVLPVILMSLGTTVNPLPLFLLQGLLFALSLLVVAPGGGGAVELLTAIVLPNFIASELVGVVVIAWRFFTYHLYLLGGGSMFFYACQRLNRLFPPELAGDGGGQTSERP